METRACNGTGAPWLKCQNSLTHFFLPPSSYKNKIRLFGSFQGRGEAGAAATSVDSFKEKQIIVSVADTGSATEPVRSQTAGHCLTSAETTPNPHCLLVHAFWGERLESSKACSQRAWSYFPHFISCLCIPEFLQSPWAVLFLKPKFTSP